MRTTATRTTQVHREQGGLVAVCCCCGLALESVDGFDIEVALGTFSQWHPAAPEALHHPAVPAGWRAAA